MEHSLHLAAKHFVQTITPHHKKTGTAGADSEDDSASDGGGDDDGDDEAIDTGDSLGKAIAFVKQVGHVITPSISCTNSCNRFVSVTIRTYTTDFYLFRCTNTGVIVTHALYFYRPLAPLSC